MQQTHYFFQAVHPSVKTLVDENLIYIDEVECFVQLNLILIGYCMCALVTVLFILLTHLLRWVRSVVVHVIFFILPESMLTIHL